MLAALLVAIPLMSTKSAAENVFEFVTCINDDGSLKKESMSYTAIANYEDFQKINENLAGNYVLENDITLPSDWDSIGSGKPFTGTLATETRNGVSYYGGIIGNNSGTVDSCANYGSIRGCVDGGGIAGQNDGNCTVNNCLNAGDVSANATNAGGIIGSNYGTISSSFTSGNVTLAAYSNNTRYGGICAYNDDAITETYYDRGQFPGDGIGYGDIVYYTCGVYPWEINDVKLYGWNPIQVTKDTGDTFKEAYNRVFPPLSERCFYCQ